MLQVDVDHVGAAADAQRLGLQVGPVTRLQLVQQLRILRGRERMWAKRSHGVLGIVEKMTRALTNSLNAFEDSGRSRSLKIVSRFIE